MNFDFTVDEVDNDSEIRRKNMKTVMRTIEIVEKLGIEYREKFRRVKGVTDYIYDRLPIEHKLDKKYILVLLRYARFLRKEGLWDIALQEDWLADEIREKIQKKVAEDEKKAREEIAKRYG